MSFIINIIIYDIIKYVSATALIKNLLLAAFYQLTYHNNIRNILHLHWFQI